MSSDCDWRWLRFMPVSLQFSQRELGMSRTSWLLTVALAVLLASLLLFVDEAQAQDGDLTEQSNGGAGQDPETESPANRATCDEAPDVFFLLCEVFNLITTEYVDPIDDTASLADASAQGVRDAELELIDADSEPPVCALPTPDFEETCAEIDKAEDAAAAVWAAAAQMVSSLGDRNTALITEIYQQGIDDLLENVQQRLGMGLALLDGEHPCEEFTETCRPVIFEIYPDSPAASAGLMAGDVVLEVNGPLPSDLSCAAVSNLDKFSGGETAVVKVSRADGDDDDTDPDTVTVTLESAKFDVPVVRNRVVDGEIGYLRLDAFSSSSATKMRELLSDLLDDGVAAVVLDLRTNLGGYVTAATEIAGLFLLDQTVAAHLLSRAGEETLFADGNPLAPDPDQLSLTVATTRRSASASELLTGALVDNGRAIHVGDTTYGKNTGQVVYEFTDADDNVIGYLRLTTVHWLTPNMRSAAGGFEPDEKINLPACLHPDEVARRAVASLRPRIAQVAITSTPLNNDEYQPGEALRVTVAFTSQVVVDTSVGVPALNLTIGRAKRQATYVSGNDTSELIFEYVVSNDDSHLHSISVPADPLTLSNTSIRNQAGLNAILAYGKEVVPACADGYAAQDSAGNPFTDLSESSWVAGYLACLVALNVTTGTSPSTYSPAGLVTREQMAAFLARLYQAITGEPAPVAITPFSDISTSFAGDDIARIYGLGITTGTSPTMYSPAGLVTREQMAAFLARLYQAITGEPAPVAITPFSDISTSFAGDDIARIYGLGITTGTSPTMYSPAGLVTREQMAAFLARFYRPHFTEEKLLGAFIGSGLRLWTASSYADD